MGVAGTPVRYLPPLLGCSPPKKGPKGLFWAFRLVKLSEGGHVERLQLIGRFNTPVTKQSATELRLLGRGSTVRSVLHACMGVGALLI